MITEEQAREHLRSAIFVRVTEKDIREGRRSCLAGISSAATISQNCAIARALQRATKADRVFVSTKSASITFDHFRGTWFASLPNNVRDWIRQFDASAVGDAPDPQPYEFGLSFELIEPTAISWEQLQEFAGSSPSSHFAEVDS